MPYTVECSECAMYAALATVARLAGDAEKIWEHLPIPSRIAFNRIVGDATEHYRKAS